jgi:DNA-directed RNA polymerase specialized sigma subunit
MSLAELVTTAKAGDNNAVNQLWEGSFATIQKAASQVARRSSHNITEDDLTSEVVIEFPKILRRFQPERGVKWEQYIYYAAYRAAMDRVRASDPLGLGHPIVRRGRKGYPVWCSSVDFSPEQLEAGIRNLDNARSTIRPPKR